MPAARAPTRSARCARSERADFVRLRCSAAQTVGDLLSKVAQISSGQILGTPVFQVKSLKFLVAGPGEVLARSLNEEPSATDHSRSRAAARRWASTSAKPL